MEGPHGCACAARTPQGRPKSNAADRSSASLRRACFDCGLHVVHQVRSLGRPGSGFRRGGNSDSLEHGLAQGGIIAHNRDVVTSFDLMTKASDVSNDDRDVVQVRPLQYA